ncbi:hypothetical protein CTI12_AA461160 [Artemisia annua]|uniref:Cathepsin propeptide inhibitor domain-containing protein n=1 Tax=Artemisia annua TaxID=35608 RepID=A0A2U1KU93_ARTAN|nr:hypothetical protein CTI12_AA461160 [Artemisia annua]
MPPQEEDADILAFQEWKKTWYKNYATSDEDKTRFENFKENLRYSREYHPPPPSSGLTLLELLDDKADRPFEEHFGYFRLDRDLMANPKCSLLVAIDPEDRTDMIITLYGDAIPVHETQIDDVRASYLAKHPDAFWVDFSDFQFFRIEPKVVSFVSGVRCYSFEFTNKEYKEAKVDQIY